MFVDQVKIKITSGHGGNGHIGFRRAKYVPNGGPNGGDGGRGGDIVFVADTGVNTLVDFRYQKNFVAEAGANGSTDNRTGRNGKDLIIKVPVGTLIRYGWETTRSSAEPQGNSEPNSNNEPNSNGESNSNSESNVNNEPNSNGESNSNSESNVNGEPNSNSEPNSNNESNSNSEPNSRHEPRNNSATNNNPPRDKFTGFVMADLTEPGERRVLAKGGRGGRGNQHFATPTRQAPKFAEDGKPGKTYQVTLELKLIADAGIIGFPNAGKSLLLSRVTNANPKVAGYQFTTLTPNLGVVRNDSGANFVLADIPGLIEGASTGAGLGHDFLRHIERTKVLIHVVDTPRLEDDRLTPAEAVAAINAELYAYNPALLKRPQIIAANKTDLPVPPAYMTELRDYAAERGWPVYAISAATGEGLGELMNGVAESLAQYPEDIVFEPDYEVFFEPETLSEAITVEKAREGYYRVEGPGIERILGYTNMEDEKGFAFFQRFMREKGILAQLEALGIQENDTVQLYEFEFTYWP